MRMSENAGKHYNIEEMDKLLKEYRWEDLSKAPARFTAVNRMIIRDLNNSKGQSTPSFYKYTKDNISDWLKDPYKNQRELRRAVIYMYCASMHFRRLIQYFTTLTDLSYYISPTKIDPATQNAKTINRNYRRVLNMLSSFEIKSQFPKIITVCLREDVFYGTIHPGTDYSTIQRLPNEYCQITSIENNVFNVTFDFSFFDKYPRHLEFYPEEFRVKYEIYKESKTNREKYKEVLRYQELGSPNSFAIKCNADIEEYPIPPFIGILREIFDIDNYKDLKMVKTELENYALLVMNLGMDDDGNYQMDYKKAVEFFNNLSTELPEEVGAVLSPMDIDKISFERNNVGDTTTVADAEDELWRAAGVSAQLFNDKHTTANALKLSIMADQEITYGIVKSIEDMMNRYIQANNYGKYFKITFLNVSPYNRDAMADQYLKAAQYGAPTISAYLATIGIGQAEADCMNFLEQDVLKLPYRFTPLQSSATMSSDSEAPTDEGGAPIKDDDELSDAGEATRDAL